MPAGWTEGRHHSLSCSRIAVPHTSNLYHTIPSVIPDFGSLDGRRNLPLILLPSSAPSYLLTPPPIDLTPSSLLPMQLRPLSPRSFSPDHKAAHSSNLLQDDGILKCLTTKPEESDVWYTRRYDDVTWLYTPWSLRTC